MSQDLNALAAEIHAANSKWWHDLETGERLKRNKYEMLMLIVSEISEAMEGERKNLNDSHLTHRKMAEVELADVLIRVYDFAGGFEYKLSPQKHDFHESSNKGAMLFEIVELVTHTGMSIGYGAFRTVEEYLSLIIAAVYEYSRIWGYDVDAAVMEKRAYNAIRVDHSKEARLAAGGKKW